MVKFWSFIAEQLAGYSEASMLGPDENELRISEALEERLKKMQTQIDGGLLADRVIQLTIGYDELSILISGLRSERELHDKVYALKKMKLHLAQLQVSLWSGGKLKGLEEHGLEIRKTDMPSPVLRLLYLRMLNHDFPRRLPTISGKTFENPIPKMRSELESKPKFLGYKTSVDERLAWGVVRALTEMFRAASPEAMAKTLREKCGLKDIPDPPRPSATVKRTRRKTR